MREELRSLEAFAVSAQVDIDHYQDLAKEFLANPEISVDEKLELIKDNNFLKFYRRNPYIPEWFGDFKMLLPRRIDIFDTWSKYERFDLVLCIEILKDNGVDQEDIDDLLKEALKSGEILFHLDW